MGGAADATVFRVAVLGFGPAVRVGGGQRRGQPNAVALCGPHPCAGHPVDVVLDGPGPCERPFCQRLFHLSIRIILEHAELFAKGRPRAGLRRRGWVQGRLSVHVPHRHRPEAERSPPRRPNFYKISTLMILTIL